MLVVQDDGRNGPVGALVATVLNIGRVNAITVTQLDKLVVTADRTKRNLVPVLGVPYLAPVAVVLLIQQEEGVIPLVIYFTNNVSEMLIIQITKQCMLTKKPLACYRRLFSLYSKYTFPCFCLG